MSYGVVNARPPIFSVSAVVLSLQCADALRGQVSGFVQREAGINIRDLRRMMSSTIVSSCLMPK